MVKIEHARDLHHVAMILKPSPRSAGPVLDEVAAKGYGGICFYGLQVGQDEDLMDGAEGGHRIEQLAELCLMAQQRGLFSQVFTQYQKKHGSYLETHPSDVMQVISVPTRLVGGHSGADTDESAAAGAAGKAANFKPFDWTDSRGRAWGCIFNRPYLERYQKFVRDLAALPHLRVIYLNDEARLGGSNGFGCYCPSCQKDHRQEFSCDIPTSFDWNDPAWHQFLQWRFRRWCSLHAELTGAAKKVNPDIHVGFSCTPVVDGRNCSAWLSGIDLAGMMEHLDIMSFGAYHTFDGSVPQLRPYAVSIGETGRFAAALARPKPSLLFVQGFNPSDAPSAALERDGWWMGVIPFAVGASMTAAYMYETHRGNPSCATYEESLRLRDDLARHEPLAYAAVVHGHDSESYHDVAPGAGTGSYHPRYLLAASEALRHGGVPYAFLMDRHLTSAGLESYRCVVLPQISVLDDERAAALEQFVREGGGLVAMGQLDATNALGADRATSATSLAARVFGVRIGPSGDDALADVVEAHEVAHDLKRGHPISGDEIDLAFKDAHAVEILADDVKVVACFEHDPQRPAVVVRQVGKGRAAYFAGTPSRRGPGTLWGGPSFSPVLFANAVNWSAGGPPPLRASGLPTVTDYIRTRPTDPRYVPTHEFFPMAGHNSYLAIVASYWGEVTDLTLHADLPPGASSFTQVTELVHQRSVAAETTDGVLSIPVHVEMSDAILAFLIEWE